jgi:RNA polymerase sigma factor (sigma-70 family)
MDKAQQEVDHLYKNYFGKMVATLLRLSKDIDFETAEDVVQDTFSAALDSWRKGSIPNNPSGWIYTVCKNKALNKIKAGKKITSLSVHERPLQPDYDFSETPFDDEQLALLFACAHPDLAPKVQVVITLKYVMNFKVEAIAKILAMTIDGVDKLLVRARQKIRDERILLVVPDLSRVKDRLSIVHKIIYLIFNEGYKSSWGKEILREELSEDALLMCRALLDSKIGNKETAALYALMLFNASRLKARFGLTGELLDLEQQDRNLWNHDLISLGCHFLQQSKSNVISSYHYESSIAYLHCTAKDFNSTDWQTITKLYHKLIQLNPNPFVELNYAIALYYAGRVEEAMKLLNDLQQKPFLNNYYLLNATLGRIHLSMGNLSEAKRFLTKTLQQTNFQIEKNFIQKMLDGIQ